LRVNRTYMQQQNSAANRFSLCFRPVSGTPCERGGRAAQKRNNMARKPGTRTVGEFVLFDVTYEDGTQRSNRRVPASALGGLDGDEPAKAIIAEQDAEIAEKSGQPRGPIKSIRRAGEPEPRSLQKSERVAQR
jgi:hypothetical protein